MVNIEIDLAQPEFGFEAKDSYGHTVRFDSSHESGGKDFGVRPMQSLLMALGTCSGIDIVEILNKKRQHPTAFHMQIAGEREKDVTPALWKKVHVRFSLTGPITAKGARDAISLSIEKYCSVAETLRRAGCEISWEVEISRS